MKRYEINDEVQDWLLKINIDAWYLVHATNDMLFCKSQTEDMFKFIVSTAETLGKEADKLRQITYRKSEE